MKPIKMFGLAALLALLAMAFAGASSAMAESTGLCSSEAEDCEAVTHVHETSVGKGVLLSSLATIECEVLFLGDLVVGETAPLKITGHFTYPMEGCKTTSGTLCEVTETSKEASITVLRTAHELAEVKGTAEVNAHCGSLINCTYDGEGLLGHGLGPLLSKSANGNVNISEQVTHKTGGLFCPKEAKLDLTTTPLSPTYIVGALAYCADLQHATNGLFTNSTCTAAAANSLYEVFFSPNVYAVGASVCVAHPGLWKEKVNGACATDEANPKTGNFEKATVTTVY